MLWIVGALLRLRTLRLVAMILEPNFHLRRCQINLAGQVLTFRRRQITLLPESSFQLVRLMLREEYASLALLAAGARLLCAATIVLHIEFVHAIHAVHIVHLFALAIMIL